MLKSREDFVTLFDNNFLPQGIALHSSLMRHAGPFRLWILCMDELVYRNLSHLRLTNVNLLSLSECETADLLNVKAGRTRAEYCWTLTPFTFEFVQGNSDADRVTYVDAHLFFFDDPRLLIRELDEAGKSVLITEHAYAPEYDRSKECGRFCVQFMTFDSLDRQSDPEHYLPLHRRIARSMKSVLLHGNIRGAAYQELW